MIYLQELKTELRQRLSAESGHVFDYAARWTGVPPFITTNHPDLAPYDQLSPEKQENNNCEPQRQLLKVLRTVLPDLQWSLDQIDGHRCDKPA